MTSLYETAEEEGLPFSFQTIPCTRPSYPSLPERRHFPKTGTAEKAALRCFRATRRLCLPDASPLR